ncbi:uncharacterized protein LOC113007040 isoform X2 [Astatotilapia calliptera]|uniref:uncharacterized protein LOC113007040 isoform X2 n=1 Tax=Astatotilapia calliptera TaxID=8154 RepID=UPI000E415302|nr:uncharacterized protein LOC113007040 isoform X2 [Astatotilapia calliptera]
MPLDGAVSFGVPLRAQEMMMGIYRDIHGSASLHWCNVGVQCPQCNHDGFSLRDLFETQSVEQLKHQKCLQPTSTIHLRGICIPFFYWINALMRWVDETGSVLWDRDVKNTGRTCVSLLTVKLQSGNKKRYTCQFEDNNTVKIEAHYTPVLIGTPDRSPLNYITWALRFVGLTVMIVITVLVIRHKGTLCW